MAAMRLTTASNAIEKGRSGFTGRPGEKRGRRFLTFRIGGEIFGVEVIRAREILDYQEPTEIPRLPEEILGVVNLRGRIVPIIDLRCKFGLPAAAPTRESCLVILEVECDGEQTLAGVLADAVLEVLELAEEEIDPLPRMGTRLPAEYLRGLGKQGTKLFFLLDVDRVFARNPNEISRDVVCSE